jgi:hypothetical protein
MKSDGKVNEFARDLYRDLRDRRLLPVVALLLVGIIAAPLLIKGSDSGPPPSSAPLADADPFDGAAELRPVVVGDDPGLRNFHERLDGSPSRNPFKQQLVPKAIVSDTGNSASGSGTGLQTQETATDSPTSSDTSDSGSSDDGSSDDGNASDNGNGNGHGNGNGNGHGPPKDDTVLEASIDVKVGPAGSTKVLEGVRKLTLLPSNGHPIVQYTGSDKAGKRASFAVSGDVVSTEGEGVCKPSPADCRFLSMRIGQQKKLVNGDGKTYILKLLAVHIERVHVKSGTEAEGLSADQQGSLPG